MPGPREFQQQPAAHHVAQGAVGLSPPPRFAQPQRKLPPIGVGMLGDQLTDKFHFRRRDHPAPIAKFSFHDPERTRDVFRTQAPALLFLNSKHSRAATLGPPGSLLDHPLPTRLAVDAPPDSAPPRAHSVLPATSENALSKAVSARARIPGRRRPKCESLFRVGCGRRTGSPRKGRLAQLSQLEAFSGEIWCGQRDNS